MNQKSLYVEACYRHYSNNIKYNQITGTRNQKLFVRTKAISSSKTSKGKNVLGLQRIYFQLRLLCFVEDLA